MARYEQARVVGASKARKLGECGSFYQYEAQTRVQYRGLLVAFASPKTIRLQGGFSKMRKNDQIQIVRSDMAISGQV